MARISQSIAKIIIWAVSLSVIMTLTAIVVFILSKGLPVVNGRFLTEIPREMGREGGILSPIVGTVSVTVLAALIAAPFGIGTAVYLSEYTKGGIAARVIRFAAESLAGIPSIVYGLFGFVFFVILLGLGWSVISCALTLALMILPTIIRTSQEAIGAVPQSYREVSFSLGATKWQTVRKAVIPSAMRGIVNGVMLGVGRCAAETAAVMLTLGAALRMPDSLLSSSRTMAVHFYLLATEGIADGNAYGTAAVLILIIFVVNVLTDFVLEWGLG